MTPKSDLASVVATLTSTRAASAKAKKKAGRPKSSEQAKKDDQEDEKKKKSPKDGKKREWKETVLRKGWLAFRAEYLKNHKNSGKTAKELNQEAGEERGT